MFLKAISHLSSFARVFTINRGHAFIVYVKSSSRKTLVRLELHMPSIDPYEIAITKSYSLINGMKIYLIC